jgi:hypothetical protein
VKKLKKTTLTVAASLLLLPGSSWLASERLENATNMLPQLEETNPSEVLSGVSQRQYWTCPGCTDVENRVLKALQNQGITDKNALAVLMGNIKQESKFETTICEGGKRTGYHGCHSGGFGLIQWTTEPRYNGLGRLARQYQLDPDSLDAQLKWLFAEVEWKKVEHRFKTPGKSRGYYMSAAYRWLGWGVHGARTHYSNQYANWLELV